MTSPEPNYLSGFGNEFATEAIPGALPQGRNSPQRAPLGLYAEQLSGTAFTAARAENRRTWMYRRQPSVVTGRFEAYAQALWTSGAGGGRAIPPDPLRWRPFPIPQDEVDFIDGLRTIAANGDVESQTGVAALVYVANRSMTRRALINADAEMLLVPQQGRLIVRTELGVLHARPGEVLLLPRGLALRIELPDGPSRGYVAENYGPQFRLPELGPIGSNGLANARDFLSPVAAYESADGEYEIVKKFGARLWRCTQTASPFNVLAWHGNLAPCKYDTANFMAIGSISFDHPDPSIFTVLTSPSPMSGAANCDFVIFPPRWMVAEDTFRPAWYHRNVMSEFMGLVHGQYDAKPEGFKPGGASLHNCMVPHGPDAEAFDKASSIALAPYKLDNTLAFMFESRLRFVPTDYAITCGALDPAYSDCWAKLADRLVLPRQAPAA
ncbi:MAG: homogentisate 1,2-dioxygenase [Burkholderiaceae bacterium]